MDCHTYKGKMYQNGFGGICSALSYCFFIFIDQVLPYESEQQNISILRQVSTTIW